MILKYLKAGPPLLSGPLRSSHGPDHAQQLFQLCTTHWLLSLTSACVPPWLCPGSKPAFSPLSLSLTLSPRFVGSAVAWENVGGLTGKLSCGWYLHVEVLRLGTHRAEAWFLQLGWKGTCPLPSPLASAPALCSLLTRCWILLTMRAPVMGWGPLGQGMGTHTAVPV